MMRNEAWPTFSFTEALRPPEGWRTDCAILSTYSADLAVILTALLALAGCDLDNRRTGSRVELVKAVEALRGKVSVLAQTGRVVLPNKYRPILKLLDKFIRTVDSDETIGSWHPKISLVRYQNLADPSDRQWRVWLGSRNLTSAINWEAGLVLASRSDGKGQIIDGLAAVGKALAKGANLATLSPQSLSKELASLTWECPPGGEIHRLTLLGPGLAKGFPQPPPDIERMFVVSPFLDATTVKAAASWGGVKTHRVLVSTSMELQRLMHENKEVFAGFEDLRVRPLPDLPAEGAATLDEETHAVVEISESEEVPPAGLHAKLLFAAKGTRRQLWIGSANATQRAWQARNVEAIAELSISRDTADAIEGFVATCDRFNPNATPPKVDEDEKALEGARKLLCGQWPLRQRITENELLIEASGPPPLLATTIEIQVAALGGAWNTWPREENCVRLAGMRRWERSDFVQVRVVRGQRACAWLQIAPCDPPPDEGRDHALIAQYLDPRTFLWRLRSLLNDEPAHTAGGDWDMETHYPVSANFSDTRAEYASFMPTIEEILRSWARDSSAFAGADEKVKTYLTELQRRSGESGATADAELLSAFRRMWETLARELR